MRHRPRIVATAALIALTAGAGAAAQAPPAAPVVATISGLRSAKGNVQACMTARPAAFPYCEADPQARKRRVPAGASVTIDFGAVPPGRYAIAVQHDENANGKMDFRLMIPREGFGFSRDAPVRMSPPRFDAAAFAVGTDGARPQIRMRYF